MSSTITNTEITGRVLNGDDYAAFDNTDTLTLADAKSTLTDRYGNSLTDDQIKSLDDNDDGNISVNEFTEHAKFSSQDAAKTAMERADKDVANACNITIKTKEEYFPEGMKGFKTTEVTQPKIDPLTKKQMVDKDGNLMTEKVSVTVADWSPEQNQKYKDYRDPIVNSIESTKATSKDILRIEGEIDTNTTLKVLTENVAQLDGLGSVALLYAQKINPKVTQDQVDTALEKAGVLGRDANGLLIVKDISKIELAMKGGTDKDGNSFSGITDAINAGLDVTKQVHLETATKTADPDLMRVQTMLEETLNRTSTNGGPVFYSSMEDRIASDLAHNVINEEQATALRAEAGSLREIARFRIEDTIITDSIFKSLETETATKAAELRKLMYNALS